MGSTRRPSTILATASLLIAASLLGLPATAKEAAHHHDSEKAKPTAQKEQRQRVHAVITINCPPSDVWRSIHEERSKDPDLSYSKVIEQISPTEYKLEQKFNFIPIIGSSTCLMSHKEIVNERIDYLLLRSDRFKAMEGSWVLTPIDGGKKTRLELSSHLDMGLPVPRAFMNGVSTKKIQKRLENVKHLAESNASMVAARENHPPE